MLPGQAAKLLLAMLALCSPYRLWKDIVIVRWTRVVKCSKLRIRVMRDRGVPTHGSR